MTTQPRQTSPYGRKSPDFNARHLRQQLSPLLAYFQRKWTKTRPKLSESFSTRWYRALISF